MAQLRVDTWVMPSHTQAARVADGSLDLAICWVQNSDLKPLSLNARLVGVDRLYALCVGSDTSPVAAKDTLVLLDDDDASWSSWNRYGEQFAAATGARVMRIDDGGVTGPTFFEHVRQSAPSGAEQPQGAGRPAARRSGPAPGGGADAAVDVVTGVATRRGRTPAVQAVIEAFTADLGDRRSGRLPAVWLPPTILTRTAGECGECRTTQRRRQRGSASAYEAVVATVATLPPAR